MSDRAQEVVGREAANTYSSIFVAFLVNSCTHVLGVTFFKGKRADDHGFSETLEREKLTKNESIPHSGALRRAHTTVQGFFHASIPLCAILI